jgi:glutaminyl-tRNA synthetase
MTSVPTNTPTDFIRSAVNEDLAAGRYHSVVTRFPPEPNAYLHIGHAKAICIDFGIADEFGGRCHLRYDDTNPLKEEQEYIDAIREDVRWLGFDWGEHEYYASDYFDQLYEWALALIRSGLAYVDDQSAEQVRQTRGTLTQPGAESPFRNRSIEENLELFERMRKGEFPDGSRVLRAKIDMAAPNLNMRDPVMYRILHANHPHAGDKWCIYPMYDWAHGQSDWIEGITHSLCSLEFEDHRPLYEWYVTQLHAAGVRPLRPEQLERLQQAGQHITEPDQLPRQIEFARGNITYMVTSKRRLLELVENGYVKDWDDPRMPTLRGLRRRGYSPVAIRRFWQEAGVAKRVNNIDFAKLENVLRDELNRTANRVMAVLDPLKVVITNYPEGQVEQMEAINNPEDASAGTRQVPFSREIYIERADFMEDPPRKFFRLAPGREVRLRYAYLVTCTDMIKDADGRVTEIHCTYDPATRGGDAPDGRKVKGTIHWVSAIHAIPAEVRLYDHLFTCEDPTDPPASGNWLDNVNRESLQVIEQAWIEPSVIQAAPLMRYQFERTGYFCVDPDTTADHVVFNRTITLRDSWAKTNRKG